MPLPSGPHITMTPDPLDVLRNSFGLEGFRPWQREAIDALLTGSGRVLVVAPTGGGKSLTYQVPAAVLDGTTLVLSPLVALMEDQVRALEARGVPATFLASTLEPDERRRREAAMLRGRYKLVYAAPERLASDAFVEALARCNVQLVAVDEAHCIAQWGHDFRPDYLRIGALLQRLRPPRVLACTATATPEVRREIREQLRLGAECQRGPPRLRAAQPAPRGAQRRRRERGARRRVRGPRRRRWAKRPRPPAEAPSSTRRRAGRPSSGPRRCENAAGTRPRYHAGMAAEERSRRRHALRGSLARPRRRDQRVRHGHRPGGHPRRRARAAAVVDRGLLPGGRARGGRDGAEAWGLLLCSGADIALAPAPRHDGHATARRPRPSSRRARGPSSASSSATSTRARCRHDFILRYFGDEQELLGGCGHCDVCAALDESRATRATAATRQATATVVRMALSAVARARQRAGLVAVAEMLRGVDGERTRRFGFTELSTFGLLRERSPAWVVDLLRGLLAAGWIDLTPTEHPVPLLTRAGRRGHARDRARSASLSPSSGRRAARRGAAVAGSASAGKSARHGARVARRPSARSLRALRAHRAQMAKARGVPAYVVALDRTLLEMATRAPRSRAELLDVFGMGPARVEAYGDGFLDALRGA